MESRTRYAPPRSVALAAAPPPRPPAGSECSPAVRAPKPLRLPPLSRPRSLACGSRAGTAVGGTVGRARRPGRAPARRRGARAPSSRPPRGGVPPVDFARDPRHPPPPSGCIPSRAESRRWVHARLPHHGPTRSRTRPPRRGVRLAPPGIATRRLVTRARWAGGPSLSVRTAPRASAEAPASRPGNERTLAPHPPHALGVPYRERTDRPARRTLPRDRGAGPAGTAVRRSRCPSSRPPARALGSTARPPMLPPHGRPGSRRGGERPPDTAPRHRPDGGFPGRRGDASAAGLCAQGV